MVLASACGSRPRPKCWATRFSVPAGKTVIGTLGRSLSRAETVPSPPTATRQRHAGSAAARLTRRRPLLRASRRSPRSDRPAAGLRPSARPGAGRGRSPSFGWRRCRPKPIGPAVVLARLWRAHVRRDLARESDRCGSAAGQFALPRLGVRGRCRPCRASRCSRGRWSESPCEAAYSRSRSWLQSAMRSWTSDRCSASSPRLLLLFGIPVLERGLGTLDRFLNVLRART